MSECESREISLVLVLRSPHHHRRLSGGLRAPRTRHAIRSCSYSDMCLPDPTKHRDGHGKMR